MNRNLDQNTFYAESLTVKPARMELNNHKIVSILLVGVIFFGTLALSLAIQSETVSITSSGNIAVISPLHVEGNQIKDSFGNVVYLRGVNKVEFADDPDGIWISNLWNPQNVAAELDSMQSWGINVIRCIQAVEHWKYNMDHPMAAIAHREAIKQLLDLAAARGIYVIYTGYAVTDYYDGGSQDALPFPPYQTSANASDVISSEDDFANWWRDVANGLKDYPNVIFELWNEPDVSESLYNITQVKIQWFNACQRSVDAIRETGATQLIIFQWKTGCYVNLDSPTSAETLDWVLQNPLNDSEGNIVYSTHIYRNGGAFHHTIPTTWNAWNYSELQLAFQYMRFPEVAQQHPLIVGEIGAMVSYTGDELLHELEAFDNCLTIFDQMGIHYTVWWWRDSGGLQLHSGPPNFTPTASGQILMNHLQS